MPKYHIHWSASSNITFQGFDEIELDREPSPDETVDLALEFSGFECWVEEVEDDVDG